MYQPSTHSPNNHLIFPTHLPIYVYIYRGPASYIMGYQDETRCINSGEGSSTNWVVTGIQWILWNGPRWVKRHAQSSNSGGFFLSSWFTHILQLGLKDTLGLGGPFLDAERTL
jgi:hypothetical protein